MNRAQIERAEQTAQFLAERRHLHEKRVEEAVQAELEEAELVSFDSTERRRVYREQVLRFERYRQETLAWLIAQGIVEPEPGLFASEGAVSSEEIAAFTMRQMEVAERLLAQKR